MHEASIVESFVKMAQEYAVQNNAAKILKVVLQVGEISGIVPRYLYMFYPVVAKGTILEGSELVITTIEASVFCTECATTYNPTKTDLKCPNCGSEQCDVIDGKGLFVKEIVIEQSSSRRYGGRTWIRFVLLKLKKAFLTTMIESLICSGKDSNKRRRVLST